jgi:hypothetical protein
MIMEKTLREQAKDFVESCEYSELDQHFTFMAMDSFISAKVLNINIEWVKAKWERCEEREIYKQIIIKAKQKLYTQMSEEDEDYVKEILKDNRRRLYGKLTEDIYNYCIG